MTRRDLTVEPPDDCALIGAKLGPARVSAATLPPEGACRLGLAGLDTRLFGFS